MDRLRIGVIGVGARGSFELSLLSAMKDVEVAAVCDEYQDRLEAAYMTATASNQGVAAYTDYRELLKRERLDAVVIATSWESHIRICSAALEAGIMPAVECGGAYSLDEVWRLVRASERTGVNVMFLENCCFGREELTVLNMIKQGVFGEVVHCEGGYEHNCRALVAGRDKNRQARFGDYMERSAEIYPSHELGPIMKYLDINHGNRIISLSSTTTKAVGMTAFNGERAAQADITTTFMKCAHGESIVLTYDTTLPRPYSRGGRVDGTRGRWLEDKHSVYIEGMSPRDEWEDISAYMDKPEYEHPIWKRYREGEAHEGGHGGMDWLVLRELVESVKEKRAPYLDVYDAALITAVTALSEQSINKGGASVYVPDFTDGRWIKR